MVCHPCLVAGRLETDRSELLGMQVQLGAVLGQGSFGTTYRGRWRGADCAVKVGWTWLCFTCHTCCMAEHGLRWVTWQMLSVDTETGCADD